MGDWSSTENPGFSCSLVALTHHYDSYRWHNYELDSFDSGVLTLPDEDDWGLTRFDGHLSLEVLLPRKDVCDASCETAGVPA